MKRIRSPSGRRGAARRRSFEAGFRLEWLEDRTLLATDVWTGADSSSWSDGGNWSLGAAPRPSDVADFTNSGDGTSLLAATLDGPTTIAGLVIDSTWSETLTLEAPLTLTGTSQFSGGTIDFSKDTTGSIPLLGSLSNSGTLTISGSNVLQWSAADTISNSGTLDLAGSGTFALVNGATLANDGTIADQIGGTGFRLDSATLNNEPGGAFDFQADSTFSFSSAAGTFDNAGTLQKTAGTGASVINVKFSNQDGTIEVDSGTISLQTAGGTSSGGSFIVASGAILDLTGGKTVAYAGSYHGSGAGTVSLDSGTLAVGTGGANFDFAAGLFQWTGGTIDTSLGNLTNSGTMTLSGASGGAEHLQGTGILTNLGTIDQTGAATFDLDSPAALDNLPAATYDLAADSGISEDQFGGTLVNSGTLEKTAGTGTSAIDGGISVSDTGTVAAETGTLSLANAGQVISGGTLAGGTWVVDAGSTLALAGHVANLEGSVNLNGPGASFPALNELATIAAGGKLNITNGGSFTTAGNLDNAGALELGPATLDVTGNYTQEPTGSFDAAAGGTSPGSQFGQLIVQSQATVAGDLEITVDSGYSPALGQSLGIIPAGMLSGQFTSVSGVSLSGPVSLQVSYGAQSVSLTTVRSTKATLSSSANPASGGAPVTFTVKVQPAPPETGTPTGTVTFLDGSTTLGTAMLSGGTATFSTSTLALGTHSISVEYGGDSNFGSSSSTVLDQGIQDASETTVVSSANPGAFGNTVDLTATVSSAVSGAGTPTGSVTFMDGSTALKTAPLIGGTATFSTTTFSVASHMITALYSGDPDFAGSPSKVLTQVVNKDTTNTTVSSSTNPSVFGGSTTLTASVQAAGSPSTAPTGSVTFYDGSASLRTVPLTGGMASLPVQTLAGGTDSITAAYSGDANFSTSPSNTVSQIVRQQGTNTVLTSPGVPAVFGQSVTFTVTVNPQSAGTGPPTGTVALMNGSNPVGSGTLTAGSVTISVAALPAGMDSITAVYAGNTSFTGSTAAGFTQTVIQAGTFTVLTPSSNPGFTGQPVTVTATVISDPRGIAAPTGSVIFKEGKKTLGRAALINGSAALTTKKLALGANKIQVIYSGNADFAASSSPILKEVIKKKPAEKKRK